MGYFFFSARINYLFTNHIAYIIRTIQIFIPFPKMQGFRFKFPAEGQFDLVFLFIVLPGLFHGQIISAFGWVTNIFKFGIRRLIVINRYGIEVVVKKGRVYARIRGRASITKIDFLVFIFWFLGTLVLN